MPWFWYVVLFVLFVLFALPLYATYKKAGSDMAWGAFVPIVHAYVMLKVVGRPGWWLILFFIPIIGTIVWIMVLFELSKSFGKGGGFTVGLLLLPWIFFAILGWGSSQYRAPAASTA